MEQPDRQDLSLNEIWRACRKVQSTIFRYGFDLSGEFCKHDKRNTGLIAEPVFLNVLGKYKGIIGLSNFELRELADYFRLRDGRIAYLQFCEVVCREKKMNCKMPKMITGLEWNDPMHVNVLARPEDRRNLCLLMIKIAQITPLPLEPYFQDYELVSKNIGTVTLAHFSRVLHFMKIPLSDEDFLLLLKRYMKDSYLVNYVAFVTHLKNITNYFKEQKLLDNSKNLIANFPGRLVDLELPEMPSVDGPKLLSRIFSPSCVIAKDNKTDCEIVYCIQNYVFKNRVRVSDFFECFDPLRTGSITKNQFERALHNIGVGRYLTQREVRILCARNVDPIDSNRVLWKKFTEEIDTVFTIKYLEKTPTKVVMSPPVHIMEMPRVGTPDWNKVSQSTRDTCEEALAKIQTRVRNRRIHMHPFFKNYDKLNSGHVNCNQANQVFLTNGILLSTEEIHALHQRYGNQLGFNYTKFLENADPGEYAVPSLKEPRDLATLCKTSSTNAEEDDADREAHIIKILSKAKRQAITRSIPVKDFLEDYDRHREGQILEVDFRRGLDNSSIKLDPEDVDRLCKIFRSPKRACCVLYRDFIRALDEIFIEIESSTGDRRVTAVPLIHLANLDCFDCFLNFEDRTVCSQALMKLARKPDELSNLSAAFKDFDRENCGSIRQNQFLRALTVRDMHYMVSSRELDALYKCFGVQRGMHLEFNYREFLNVVDTLHQIGQVERRY